jgi:histidyl-tRNA synthetase
MEDNSQKKLSTEPYKGVRDFYPEDMFVQNYILGTMREVVESYGYAEYSASLLEPAELYEAKSSEEIVRDQTYTFTDRGNRRVTLRPEMTPTLARLVAARRRDVPLPLRWYSTPNVFRYERPQRGRLREHWQLNCDILGVSGIEADVEIVSIARAIMQAFGATDEDYRIKVGSRALLDEHLDQQGLDDDQKHSIMRILDKKGKIDDFDEQIERAAGKKLDLMLSQEKIEELLSAFPFPVEFDPSIVRGFDYYTGMVFEVFDASPQNNRALFGGGRYDNLLEIFGAEGLPAVGFGVGDVSMRDFLETHDLLPKYIPAIDLYIATASPNDIRSAQRLAEELRKEGINTAVNLLDRKIADQIKAARKQSAPFLLVVGEREAESGMFAVKRLETGHETSVPRERIAEVIWTSDTDENPA